MTNRLLTAPEVGELLALPVDHVYALARKGQIPHLRFGRTLRFRREAIENWLGEEEHGRGRGRATRDSGDPGGVGRRG
jgi:excisionase family DNA binding protein